MSNNELAFLMNRPEMRQPESMVESLTQSKDFTQLADRVKTLEALTDRVKTLEAFFPANILNQKLLTGTHGNYIPSLVTEQASSSEFRMQEMCRSIVYENNLKQEQKAD